MARIRFGALVSIALLVGFALSSRRRCRAALRIYDAARRRWVTVGRVRVGGGSFTLFPAAPAPPARFARRGTLRVRLDLAGRRLPSAAIDQLVAVVR